MSRIRHRVTDKGIIAFQTTADGGGRNKGLGPRLSNAGTLSEDATIGSEAGGAFVLSSSVPISASLPSAGTSAGSMYTFRVASEHAHFLTGSSDSLTAFTDGTSQGASLTLSAVVGSSVAIISDGLNFLVLANSGSVTIA